MACICGPPLASAPAWPSLNVEVAYFQPRSVPVLYTCLDDLSVFRVARTPMTLVAPWFVASLRRRLRTSLGRRFSRFVPVAVVSFAASQITLTLLLGPGHATAGISAVAAWFAGAAVSYILSRWAWERKGRPNLVRETLPFWTVSVGAAVVLTLTAKFANQEALRMGLSHPVRVLFVDVAYLMANCVTFVTRFVIFHYVLFADRGSALSSAPADRPSGAPSPSPAAGADPARVALAMGSARANGSAAWVRLPAGPPAGRSAEAVGDAMAERGRRR
jgi:putative flippase GtrA